MSTAQPTPGSLCVIGPVFLDVIMSGLDHAPRPGEEQWVSHCALMPGGAANQAVALARLGLSVTLRSYLGIDDAGGLVRAALSRDGVLTSACLPCDHQNVTVSLSYEGDRAMTTAGTDEAPHLDPLTMDPPAWVIADLTAVHANRDVLGQWRSQHGTKVVADVGWDDTGAWDPTVLDDLDLVDVFVPNEGEATRYTRTTTAEQAVRHLTHRVPLAIITCGPHGVIAAQGQDITHLPALTVPVLDTTGAGDSFTAGLVWALHHNQPLPTALALGCLTAAATLSGPGGSANAPTMAHLARLARRLPVPDSYPPGLQDLLDATTHGNHTASAINPRR